MRRIKGDDDGDHKCVKLMMVMTMIVMMKMTMGSRMWGTDPGREKCQQRALCVSSSISPVVEVLQHSNVQLCVGSCAYAIVQLCTVFGRNSKSYSILPPLMYKCTGQLFHISTTQMCDVHWVIALPYQTKTFHLYVTRYLMCVVISHLIDLRFRTDKKNCEIALGVIVINVKLLGVLSEIIRCYCYCYCCEIVRCYPPNTAIVVADPSGFHMLVSQGEEVGRWNWTKKLPQCVAGRLNYARTYNNIPMNIYQ